MALRLGAVLTKNPDVAFDFYRAASEIVDDFEDYGPVLQANEQSGYDNSTAIIKLRDCRNRLIELLGGPSQP